MLRSVLVLLSLAAASAAGCVTPTVIDPADVPDVPALGGPFSWDLTGCRNALIAVPVSADALQPHLPEGFTPVAPSAAGLPAELDALGDAILGFETFTCAEAAGLNGTIPDAPYGSVFAWVNPPEHLRDPLADIAHFVKWDTVLADGGLRSTLAALGAPVREGLSTFDLPAAVPTGSGSPDPDLFAQLYFDDGSESFAINGAPKASQTPLAGTFVEFTATADGGLVKWRASAASDSMTVGPGYVKVNALGMPLEVLGSDRAPGVILRMNGLAFTNTSVEYIPAAGAA